MTERTPDYELTPGALLRRSRQRYGWNVEDVADELKLLPDVVEAIEQDNYGQMAGWTYAVGYLRGYAKLDGVNIDEAIAKHASLLPQKEDGPGTLTHRTGARVAIPISLSWVITAVVLIVVVGGISATYLKRANDDDRVVLESVSGELELERPAPAISIEDNPAVESTEPAATSESVEASGNVIVSVERQIEVVALESKEYETDNNVAGRLISKNPELDQEAPQVIVRPLTLADMDTRIIGAISSTVTEPDPSVTIQSGTAELQTEGEVEISSVNSQVDNESRNLVLFFDQSSWADIRDSSGEQLLRESVRAGTTVRLEGKPPFIVFVGNARGVRYLYLGVEKTAPSSGDGLFGRFQVGTTE